MSSDISHLRVSQPLPRSAVNADTGAADEQLPPWVDAQNSTVATAVVISAAVAMLVISMVIVGSVYRMRRMKKSQQEINDVVIIQDMPGFMDLSVSMEIKANPIFAFYTINNSLI